MTMGIMFVMLLSMQTIKIQLQAICKYHVKVCVYLLY